MKYGSEIVPYYPAKKLGRLARRIERAGFDYLWVSDHYHNRYVHSTLTHLANITDEIHLGPGVTNPYLVHPSVTAAAVATLDEFSGGRATLGISAGDPAFLDSVGVNHEKPITAVREAIQIIQGLLGGEKVKFSGDIFTCKSAKLGFSPPKYIPIYVGGRGPQMMRLAGEIADGALFNASHPDDLKECIELVEEGAERAGRDLDDFDMVAYTATSIGEDEEEARKKARAVTSFVASSAPESTLEREGISKERVDKIRDHLMAGETGEARAAVTDRMIDVFSISGTPDVLEERIEELKDMKITQTVLGSPLGPDTQWAIDEIEKIIG